jgi:hypothetical protein
MFSKLFVSVWAFILSILPSITLSLFKAIGLGFVTYAGFSLLWSQIESYVYARYNGLPTVLLQIMDLCGIDSALGILFSAVGSVVAYKALTATKAFKFTA